MLLDLKKTTYIFGLVRVSAGLQQQLRNAHGGAEAAVKCMKSLILPCRNPISNLLCGFLPRGGRARRLR